MKQQFNIGQTFIPYGRKHAKLNTIVDILTTTNSKGKVVSIEYKTEEDCLGQKVSGSYPTSTITRSLIEQHGNNWKDFVI